MPAAVIPIAEAERLRVLRSYEVLDRPGDSQLEALTRLAVQVTGSEMAAVSLLDAERQCFVARIGIEAAERPRDLAFCAHAVLEPDALLVVPDLLADRRFADNPLVAARPPVRFYAGAPLVSPEGPALGTLCVMDRAPRELGPAQADALRTLGRAVMTQLELGRRLRLTQELVLADPLTGLSSRAAFVAAFDKAIARMYRDRLPLTVLAADLDRFRTINDRHGRPAGDSVLRAVASIFAEELRREDVVGRVAGDAFAMLLAGSDVDEARRIAERLCTAIRDGLGACGWPVTVSIGSTVFLSPPETVAAAMQAVLDRMAEAKRAGRDRVAFGIAP